MQADKKLSRQVLYQPDLLLIILAYLPQQDLLLAQRICHTWKNLITSSAVLQAALFFRPAVAEGRKGTEPGLQDIKMNPLLQDKFPPFFNHDRHGATLVQAHHNLGPWKSIYWYRGRSIRAKYPLRLKGAKQRMKAYASADASWRRMIPCSPAPTELQMHFGTWLDFEQGNSATGRVKCLTFPRDQPSQGRQTRTNHLDHKSSPSWVTFGLVYDLLEEAWFRRANQHASSLLVDMTNQDPPSDPSAPTFGMYHNIIKAKLQEALPQLSIGGPGRVLIHITSDDRGGMWESEFAPKKWPPDRIYVREFESEGSELEHLKWDKEVSVS